LTLYEKYLLSIVEIKRLSRKLFRKLFNETIYA
jgi:hypothetical protein